MTDLEYNLEELLVRFRQLYRVGRLVTIGGVTFLVLAMAYRLIFLARSIVGYELVGIASIFALIVSVNYFRAMSRFANRLYINDEGFVFYYSRRDPRKFCWSDPNLRLTFFDWRYRRAAIEHPEQFVCFVDVRLQPTWVPKVPLTVEAYVGLLEEAQRRGL